jgi:hypothetical protein
MRQFFKAIVLMLQTKPGLYGEAVTLVGHIKLGTDASVALFFYSRRPGKSFGDLSQEPGVLPEFDYHGGARVPYG